MMLQPLRNPKPALKHIALAIRAYMTRENITPVGLAKRLGVDGVKSSVTHAWVHGQGAPSALYRDQLAALLGVDPTELMARKEQNPTAEKARVARDQAVMKRPPAETTARALEAHLQAPPPPAQVLLPRKQDTVLAYSAASDGQAEVRLLARGPHARMAPIFRMLLDAGLVPGGEEDPT